jgi:hypothetical protein
MDLKTKVIRISVIIVCIIVIGVIGYLVYFIVKDTLKPPPEIAVTKNLFIEKDSIDIANLKNMDNVDNCRNLYHSIWNSLYEEKLNGLLGENQKENEIEHSFLMKSLNFAYIEQFIVLANRYFYQSNWNENFLVNECISEIKKDGFVEPNTPIWNSLQGFESSINWYNSVQNCIREINNIIYRENYFTDNNLLEITQWENNVNSQDCTKNSKKLADLSSAFYKLKNKSESFLNSKISNYNDELNRSGRNVIYKRTAFQNFEEVKDEMQQWNNAFNPSNTNNDLNKQIQNFRNNIYQFYSE